MELFTSSLPLWISLAFLVSIFVPVFMISNVVRSGTSHPSFDDSPSVRKLPNRVLVFFVLYFMYVTLMSLTGIFHVNTLPPRVMLLTAFPLLIFYFFFVFRSKTFWKILEHVELSALVRLHLFRLIGSFFIIGWMYDVLPKSFALIGGIGDIFAALSAIYVAKLIDRRAKHYKTLTLVWNIIGFWDIVSVIISAMYVTKQAIESNTEGVLEMTKFPFCLIPAFAPATIIFLHICVFKKLKSASVSE